MKGINISKLGKTFFRALSKNRSTILTVVGLAGLGATVYATAKAAPKAAKALDEAKQKKFEQRVYEQKLRVYSDEEIAEMSDEERAQFDTEISEGKAVVEGDYKDEKLTIIEKVKYTGKHWIVTGILVVATAGAVILAHYFDAKAIAGLSMLYAATKDNCDEWMNEAKKRLDPEEFKQATNEIAEKEATKQDISDSDLKPGEHWFYDVRSKNYFPATVQAIEMAFAKALGEMNHESGVVDWLTLCQYLGEAEQCPDEFSDYVFTYSRNKGLEYTLEPIPGTERYTLLYDEPAHYKELGLAHPY